MVPASVRIQHIAFSINADPTDIQFHRDVKVPQDGAFITQPKELPPQRVRLFRQSPRKAAIPRDIPGEKYSLEYFILAPAETDVEENDTFEHALYGTFRVEEVIPSVSEQIIVGYHVRVTKVDI